MKLRSLPEGVEALLQSISAPRRLRAHLVLVHDVSAQITKALRSQFPKFTFDAAAVAFGAATHDLGKALHPQELSGPGNAHELGGHRWLLEHGVPEALARFARTHASWSEPSATVEDLLVSLADKVWKGRREDSLEQLVVERICSATGEQRWDVFMKLDAVLGQVASDADERIELQGTALKGRHRT